MRRPRTRRWWTRTMTQTSDIFGHPTGPAQFSLFGEGEARMKPPEPPPHDYEGNVRRRTTALLKKLRAASVMPFNERDQRMWRTIVPQMTGWLPPEERERVCREFFAEMERLGAGT